MSLYENLLLRAKGPVIQNVPMSEHTTFQVGGPATAMVEPEDEKDLESILAWLHGKEWPWMVLGRGSNLLVSDQGFSGLVIKISSIGFRNILRTDDGFEAGAAISLPRLVGYSKSWGLGGLEFAAGIPGTLGGALTMNAGAYGGDMAQIVESVRIVDHQGARWIDSEEADFHYRGSSLPPPGAVMTGARLKLNPGDPIEIRQKIRDIAHKRRASQPPAVRGSAGCVFKNPEDAEPAGKIIDRLGLKGHALGKAEVSNIHANYVLNAGGASAQEIFMLIEDLRQRVKKDTGLQLENEVVQVGRFEEGKS